MSALPPDEFRINDDGHLVRAIWPEYADEVRVTFGPSDVLIARIVAGRRPPLWVPRVSRDAAGNLDTLTGLAGR